MRPVARLERDALYFPTTTSAPWIIPCIGQAKASCPEAGATTLTSTGVSSGSMWRTGSPCTSTASAQVSATFRVKRRITGFPGATSTRDGSNPLLVTAISLTSGPATPEAAEAGDLLVVLNV